MANIDWNVSFFLEVFQVIVKKKKKQVSATHNCEFMTLFNFSICEKQQTKLHIILSRRAVCVSLWERV